MKRDAIESANAAPAPTTAPEPHWAARNQQWLTGRFEAWANQLRAGASPRGPADLLGASPPCCPKRRPACFPPLPTWAVCSA